MEHEEEDDKVERGRGSSKMKDSLAFEGEGRKGLVAASLPDHIEHFLLLGDGAVGEGRDLMKNRKAFVQRHAVELGRRRCGQEGPDSERMMCRDRKVESCQADTVWKVHSCPSCQEDIDDFVVSLRRGRVERSLAEFSMDIDVGSM